MFVDILDDVILVVTLPRHDNDATDLLAVAKVHHPDGLLDVEVIQNGAAVQCLVEVAIDSPGGVTVHPLVARVTLVLAFIVDPRFLLERHVLN